MATVAAEQTSEMKTSDVRLVIAAILRLVLAATLPRNASASRVGPMLLVAKAADHSAASVVCG